MAEARPAPAGGPLWRVLRRLAVLFAMAIAFFPIFWLVSTSLKPQEEWAASPPVWITSHPTLQNYRIVFFPEAARRVAAQEAGSLDYKVSGSAWKAFQDSAINLDTVDDEPLRPKQVDLSKRCLRAVFDLVDARRDRPMLMGIQIDA